VPIYQYRCQLCGYTCDVWLSNAADAHLSRKCHNCINGRCDKIMSVTNFKLSGDGWAKDGYTKSKGTEERS